MKRYFYSFPVLFGLLAIGIFLNFFAVTEAKAGWNHLVSSMRWSSNTINYDIAGGFNTAQENMITDHNNSWDRQCTVNFDSDWYSGNDWWIEGIDSLGRTTISHQNNKIVKVTTRIDNSSDVSKNYTPASDEYDFAYIVAHEWGHWMRLNDDRTHTSSLMYETAKKGNLNAAPRSEDIEACNYLY